MLSIGISLTLHSLADEAPAKLSLVTPPSLHHLLRPEPPLELCPPEIRYQVFDSDQGNINREVCSTGWCFVWLIEDQYLLVAHPYVTAKPRWAGGACWSSCAENCTWRREDILWFNNIYLSQLRLGVDRYLTKIAIVNIIIIVGYQRLTVGSGYWSSARFFCEFLGDFGLRFLVRIFRHLVILVRGSWTGPGHQIAAVNTEPGKWKILSLDCSHARDQVPSHWPLLPPEGLRLAGPGHVAHCTQPLCAAAGWRRRLLVSLGLFGLVRVLSLIKSLCVVQICFLFLC